MPFLVRRILFLTDHLVYLYSVDPLQVFPFMILYPLQMGYLTANIPSFWHLMVKYHTCHYALDILKLNFIYSMHKIIIFMKQDIFEW